MADIRPKDITPAATAAAVDDWRLIDGSANGTRRMLAEQMVNVRDFGAVGDNSADDTAAIQAAFTACAASGKGLWFPPGYTFAVSSALTADGSFDIIMDSPIRKTNTGGYTVLTIGPTAELQTAERFRIRVIKTSSQEWSTAAAIGVEFKNLLRASIEVHASGFYNGVLFAGRGMGLSHCVVNLGVLLNNKVAIRLGASGGGYVTENHFLGGWIGIGSTVNPGEAATGIHLENLEAAQVKLDHNVFHKPSIEIGNAGTRASLPIKVVFGDSNRFYNVRTEGQGTELAQVSDASTTNVFTAFAEPHGGGKATVTDTSLSPSSTLETQWHIGPQRASWWNISGLAYRCVGSGSSRLTCAGAAFTGSNGSAGTIYNDRKGDSYYIVTRHGLRVGIFWSAVTLRIRTDITKKFWIKRNASQKATERLTFDANPLSPYAKVFNSAGTQLSGTAPYYATFGPRGTTTVSQGGGGYRHSATTDVDYPVCVQFHADVAYADLGIGGLGILDGFSITTDDGHPPQIETPWAQDADAVADVEPDQGYFWASRVVRHLAPAPASPMGWVCTTAGWRAPAWSISTAYVQYQLVTNDIGKIYECVTAGTSAGSGGPTGTGSAIADGTAVWDYVGAQAVFAAMPNL